MAIQYTNKTILVTVLNWGLGHASRCIPIIKTLESHNFTPIIASDGQALQFLKKEFPHILCLELPSSSIDYPENGKHFKRKLIQNLPKIAMTTWKENKIIAKWISKYDLNGIISDNRMGCYSNKIPSVYMTHQINVLTGNTTWISTLLHHYFIKRFTECWIPDVATKPNLAGKLSHTHKDYLNLKYIGPISRFEKKERPVKYQLMVVLSGPEPQRGLLEAKLISEVAKFDGSVLFVKGKIAKEQNIEKIGNTTYYNYMYSHQLEEALNESELILCRSGYSSIMDLGQLEKKAFFVPTPGQFEQEYLATKLEKERIAPYSNQEDFTIDALHKVSQYSGFTKLETPVDWTSLLSIFNKKTDR